MASNPAAVRAKSLTKPGEVSLWSTVRPLLMALASLKLTVVLLAAGMFLVFAGTMAQTRYDIWEVVHRYFRAPIAWIDLQVFFPESFFPSKPQVPGTIPFPGGWVLGALMFVNLLAAHAVRFTVQARGARLYAGLGVIALGLVVTALVIAAFEDKDGTQQATWLSYDALWAMFKWGVVLTAVGSAAATVWMFLNNDVQYRIHRWVLLTLSVILLGVAGYLVFAGDSARMNDPSMRILSQLLGATFAGLVLLAGCYLAFKKRAGIVVLHLGIGLLMFNEIWVHGTHVEAQVTLEEEQGGGRADRVAANWAHDIRELELAAVIRGGGAEGQDLTVAIPESRLLEGADEAGQPRNSLTRALLWLLPNREEEHYPRISDEALPFDVQVKGKSFFRNSETQFLPSSERNDTATAGHGRFVKLIEKPPVTGVDKGENQPAAYIELFDKESGKSLGTHLVSVEQSMHADWAATNLSGLEEVTVAGRTYELYLRYKRVKKPYTVTLKDVRRDNYLGTDTPRNYSSDILIEGQDARGGPIKTTAHVWMNNPLRLFGDTFYQSGHHPRTLFTAERTTLSVVTNGGWMIPYVCCMIVAVGMCFQFVLTLLRFLTRLVATPTPALATSTPNAPVVADAVDDATPSELPNAERTGQGRGAPAAQRNNRGKRNAERGPQKKAAAGTAASPTLPSSTPKSPPRTWPNWVIPSVILLIFLYGVGRGFRSPKPRDDGLRLYEFGQIPVAEGGRLPPLDSLARNSLRILSGKEEYIDYRVSDDDVNWRGKMMRVLTGNPDSGKPKSPAALWLLDVMSGSDDARKQRVIKIESLEVLKHLSLEQRKGFLYSYEEINADRPRRAAFEQAVDEADKERERNPKGLTIFQRKILKLREQLTLFDKLQVTNVVPRKNANVLELASHLTRIAELQIQNKLRMTPLLAPRTSATEPWEPLAYAAARARVQQLAAKHRVKSLPELEQALRKEMEGDAAARARQFVLQRFAIETIENVLSSDGVKRPPAELRQQAIQRLHDMPDGLRRTLEQRLSETFDELPAADREEHLRESRDIVLQQALPQGVLETIVGDEPLGRPDPTAVALLNLMNAARDSEADRSSRDISAFNSALDDYQLAMENASARDYVPRKVRFEAYFNHAAPFFYAWVIHIVAFILVVLSWALALTGWRKPFNNAATCLILLALVIHALAILARLYISGRPPVTNLYSSAVFIGFGGVVAGLIIERLLNIGVGNALAAVFGFGTLLIAHQLSGDGDTFTVLQAVLDTQFWLATHVVCITLGYAATFIAGMLGIFYVLAGILSPVLSRKMSEFSDSPDPLATMVTAVAAHAVLGPLAGVAVHTFASAGRALAPNMTLSQLLGKVIYGVVCFGLIFSFVGTVLGGLWADDSWGRFWGWDPKENGALLIVIWNAIVLHARWGGMIKDRGLAVMSLGGNIVTAWSWFGVNELGIGLHSYGFTEGVMYALSLFWASQFVLIIVGSLPKSWWWSFSVPGGDSGSDGAGQGA